LYFASLSAAESLWLQREALAYCFRDRSSHLYRTSFERKWTARNGAIDAIATPSARAGLFALLASLGIGQGDEVLVTGFTCAAVPEPIQFCGAKPVYIDIDLQRYGMIPALAAEAITSRTKAIIAQHTFGLPAPVEPLGELARRHNLFLIEDCALGLGSQVEGRRLGSFGHASIFSFELSKTVTAGWGGMVQVNRDIDVARRVRSARDGAGRLPSRTAIRRLFQAGLSGILYRPELNYYSGKAVALLFRLGLFVPSATSGGGEVPTRDYLAAPGDAQWYVLSKQIDRLDSMMEARRVTAAAYQEVLNSHGREAVIPGALGGVRLIRFPLLVNDPNRFMRYFADVGIEVGRWFSQPVSCRGDMGRYGYRTGSCPNAELAGAHIVNLPMHNRLTAADAALVAETLDRYLQRFPEEREFVVDSVDDARPDCAFSGKTGS
jgi:perosamine synthetase